MSRLWGLVGLALLAGCDFGSTPANPMVLTVEGTRLLIAGEITTKSPAAFEALIAQNPQLTTVVPQVMEGSLDDEAVLRMGYFLRAQGLDTHLTAHSEIYSGAVDLFLSGRTRTMQRGAVIGVHSWADGFGDGADYAADRPEHRGYVAYMRQMIGSDAFYWFTLQAAPSTEIYEMNETEIVRFGLLTAPIQN